MPKLNVLFSYAYIRGDKFQTEVILRLSRVIDFLIDSGAFTNHTQGLKAAATGKAFNGITVDEYITACQQFQGHVWQFIMLDVLGNPEGTHRNLQTMLDAGLTPMPVFVNGDDFEWAKELVKINPHVCVGGVVGARMEFAAQRYQQVSAATDGAIRIHSLGFVRWPEIFQLPIFSCDSSSWCGGGQWGNISRFIPSQGVKSMKLEELRAGKKGTEEWMDFIVQCGVEVGRLVDPSTYRKTTGLPAQTTINAYVSLHAEAARRGRKYFFACPNLNWFNNLIGVVGAHRKGIFDLKESLTIKENLDTLFKSRDADAYCDAIVQVLAEATPC